VGNATGSRICAGLVCACDADPAGIAALLDPRDPVVTLDLLVLLSQHRPLATEELAVERQLRAIARRQGWHHVGLFAVPEGER